MDKMNLLGQERFNLRIGFAGQILRPTDGSIDALYHVLQIGDGTLFLGNHSFPVPLVYIQRMQVIQLFVSTNSVHIRIDAVTRLYRIFCQTQTLPFG